MKCLVTYNRTRDIQIYDYEGSNHLIEIIMQQYNVDKEEAKDLMESMIENHDELTESNWKDNNNGTEIVLGLIEADSEEDAKTFFSLNVYMKERMRVYALNY